MNHVLDSITNQFRGFLTGALVEIINQEKVAAKAAELQRVRLVASEMLRDPVFLSGTWTLDQAIDELFKRAALPEAVVPVQGYTVEGPGSVTREQTGAYGAHVSFVSGPGESEAQRAGEFNGGAYTGGGAQRALAAELPGPAYATSTDAEAHANAVTERLLEATARFNAEDEALRNTAP